VVGLSYRKQLTAETIAAQLVSSDGGWRELWEGGLVASESASTSNERPFYARHAAAYDALITEPVEPWVEAINGVVGTSAVPSQVRLLDAGCGTGRHAAAFSDSKYAVEMADASRELLAIAQLRCPATPAHLVDITRFRLDHRFDVVTCRGVLNDMTTTAERRSAIQCLADHVAPGGHLILDVRERSATASRGPTKTSKRVETLEGELIFTNETRWESPVVFSRETFTLTRPSGTVETSEFDFAMRPWAESELREMLSSVGLDEVHITTAWYRPNADRLFATARRKQG
jgi:glycine/sarcosine N-methyltransferase